MQIFSVFFYDAVAGGGREEEKCVKAPHWRVELSEKITLSKFELSLDVCMEKHESDVVKREEKWSERGSTT